MKQFFGLKSSLRSRRDAESLHTRSPLPKELRGPLSKKLRPRARRSFLERLEDRNLLTGMPYGALPDDTAEYMLGDVYVNVVLMESDSNLAPFNNSTENWTAAEIASVKSNISAGLKWWEDTLDAIPDVRDGLLKFNIDWTHANSPVHTGYEPIANTSQEFANWVYDFLDTVGFTQTGNFLTDLRAYNNAQRIAHNANWAFTIFVVDVSHDLATDFHDLDHEIPDDEDPLIDYDGRGKFYFNPDGSVQTAFTRSFAYAGGNAFVMPADRLESSTSTASIVSHETGHIFWAFDEYETSTNAWQNRRGYYNTQNSNSSSNPASGFVQADSIMSTGFRLDNAYAAHTSSVPSLETIGWKDSDGDHIFDVLDVPFSLSGTGKYDNATSLFKFVGKSTVRTLANQNSAGLKNDITINQIDRAEYSIDGGAWTGIGPGYHKYSADLNLDIPVTPGASQIRIRTIDNRTGVTSVIYTANLTNKPQNSPQPGISGFVFGDSNGGGAWDSLENGLGGWTVQLVNAEGNPLDLHRKLEPDDYTYGALLNNVMAPQVVVSAVGGDVANDEVRARNAFSASTEAFGKVFFNNSITDGQPVDTWTGGRQLQIDFASGVSEVNIKAIGASFGVVAYTQVDGDQSSSEIQQVYLPGSPTGGTFTLTFNGQTTGNIPYNASASAVASALQALSKIGAGNVTVEKTPGVWTISFRGALANRDVSELTGSSAKLIGPSVGRLEIYNSSGILLARYTTGVLTPGNSEVMKLVRPQKDIAYAIAGGHAGTKIVLDTLEWGPTSSTVTDQFGFYSLPELPAGLYYVEPVLKPFYQQTYPVIFEYQTVDLFNPIAGASQVNFGYQPNNPWRNSVNALDVNKDGFITAIDALLGINYINTHDTTLLLPPTKPPTEKFYDVNNDGYVTAIDVLQVINELNRAPAFPPVGEGPTGGGSGGIGGGGAGGSAEGEADIVAVAVPTGKALATWYYSQNPLQVLQVPGSTGCTCTQCTTIAEVAAGRVGSTAVKAAAPAVIKTMTPAAIKPLELQSFAAAKKTANTQAQSKASAVHIDGSLLHTIAAARKPAITARRYR